MSAPALLGNYFQSGVLPLKLVSFNTDVDERSRPFHFFNCKALPVNED